MQISDFKGSKYEKKRLVIQQLSNNNLRDAREIK